MSRAIISQREARRLRKRVDELERQRDTQIASWVADYPGGTHLGTVTVDKDWLWGALRAAHKLRHALVVKVDDAGGIRFYAVKA